MACSYCARSTSISVSCAVRGVELRLRLRDIGLRRGAALEAVFRELKRVGVGLDRVLQQLLLRIGGAQLEIVVGKFGLNAQRRGGEVGAVACASSRAAFTVRRTRPQKSTS